jgi:predicted transcriptional regulator
MLQPVSIPVGGVVTKTPIVDTSIKLPADVHRKLKARAKRMRRSLTAQIQVELEQAVRDDPDPGDDQDALVNQP